LHLNEKSFIIFFGLLKQTIILLSLENQKTLRAAKEDSENITEQQKNKKINEVLEDMCIYGEITKKEIKKEKEEHPEKFVETSQALNMENQDPGLFALGLISLLHYSFHY